MQIEAHAKINLTLEVLGTRPDGYHELRSIVAAIPLHDDVELQDAPTGEVSVEMVGDGLEVPDVPNEKNLAVRAARALQKACGVSRGVRIRIVKRIPAGAGLGGGSADAAAVLNGLNELWGLGLSTEMGRSVTSWMQSIIHLRVSTSSASGTEAQQSMKVAPASSWMRARCLMNSASRLAMASATLGMLPLIFSPMIIIEQSPSLY
jgi:4-diphosphocytidyl-2-C-methyl-D-erythritol kinase